MSAEVQLIFIVEFPHARGGMVRSVMTLIIGLSRCYSVGLVCPQDSEIAKKLRQDCPAVTIRECLREWVVDWRRPWATWKTVIGVSAEILALRRAGPALVITNNVGAEFLAWGCGRLAEPRLFVARGGDYRGLSAWALRWALNGTVAVVSTTAQHRLKLAKLGGARLFDKSVVIWNGIDVQPLLALPVPTWNGLGQKVRIGVIGFPSERKNQLLLVEAAALLCSAGCSNECYFFGLSSSPEDVVYEKKIRRRISELGLESQFRWCGYVEDTVKLYSAIDIVVSTSIEEGFGRTIVEAMAAGRPVIALRCSGGPTELIRDGEDGLLIENSPEALATALQGLVMNQGHCAQLSSNGRLRAFEDFSENRYVENYRRLLETLPLSFTIKQAEENHV